MEIKQQNNEKNGMFEAFIDGRHAGEMTYTWAGEDKFIRWSGYDDGFWWNNVAATEHFTDRKGEATGKTYRLDPATNLVTVI